MFTDCNLFGIITGTETDKVCRIVVDYPTQQIINQHFSKIMQDSRILEKDRVPFDGRYKPETTEILVIENYDMDKAITEAIQSPISENTLDQVAIDVPNLKAVFIGDIVNDERIIVMQRIQKSQHLSCEGIKLLQRKDTFEIVGENGFTLSEKIDAAYVGENLLFSSYYFARQIFDLSDYYRIATDHDLEAFVNEVSIEVEDRNVFEENTDSWVRRKIALIKDSKVMDQHSVASIRETAREYKVEIQTREVDGLEKIVMPNDKKALKEVLKFLDEDIYKGPLTDKTYESNSKMVKR